jgi:hypothetical protein
LRIVGALSFDQQDALAAEIVRRFPADPREPRVRNRCAEASYGYRAVHVITCVGDGSIEVQVRTLAQHMWANLMERLADRLGRQIRYGEPPIAPPGASQQNVEALVSSMMALSDEWAAEPPDVHPGLVLELDQFMDQLWRQIAVRLGEVGLDLRVKVRKCGTS